MSYLLTPQAGLDPSRVFDKGCYESRLRELTNNIIDYILVPQDLDEWVMKHRREFRPVPPYPADRERFYEQAKKEAEKIIEEERRLVVEERTNYIRNRLNLTIRMLRFLVLTEHGKSKVYIEKRLVARTNGLGYDERDVVYFESYPSGVHKVEEISNIMTGISSFTDYVPYMSPELVELYREAVDLGTLEFVRIEEGKSVATEETEKTQEADSANKGSGSERS